MQFHSIFRLEVFALANVTIHQTFSIQLLKFEPLLQELLNSWHAARLFDFLGCRHWYHKVCKGFPNFRISTQVFSWSWPAKTSVTSRLIVCKECKISQISVCLFFVAIFAKCSWRNLPPSSRTHSLPRLSWKGCFSALDLSCRCAIRMHLKNKAVHVASVVGILQPHGVSHCLRFVRCQREEVCACSQKLHLSLLRSLWLCWLHSLIALLALLWPNAWSYGPVCADWNCPPGAVLNALHARGCACMQDPLDIGPCAKVLVWAVWAICGTVEKFPLANALRLLPGSAASREYWEGWSKWRTKGIHTSAGRTGPSLWSTRSKDGTGVATARTESGQRHQSWMAKHLWYFAPC